MSDEKLLIGPRIKRLRTSLGLTQARMAGDLGISASYLNLMERNQRAVSAKVLVRLAERYDIDMAGFTGAGDAHLVAELHEALRDPLFRGDSISKNEAEDIVGISPSAAKAFLRLYGQHRDRALQTHYGTEVAADGLDLLEQSNAAVAGVRRFIHTNANHFDALDRAAEELSQTLGGTKSLLIAALTQRLKDEHDLSVRIVPVDIMPEMLRYFDRHAKRINLSELLPQSGRRFQLAHQIGMLEHRDTIDAIVKSAKLPGSDAERLCRTTLANYFAAAVLMPYGRFLKEAENCRYDVELLAHRFGTSFEQTAHRMTTLGRSDARGVPFFFVRMDVAGNITKRFSAGRFQLPQFGGACPLWNVHAAFQSPGRTLTQMVETPDGAKYITAARRVTRGGGSFAEPAQSFAVGIGCDIAYAPRVIYAASDSPTPIGPNCYLCERQNCRARAHPPLGKALSFDERARGMSLFRFDDG